MCVQNRIYSGKNSPQIKGNFYRSMVEAVTDFGALILELYDPRSSVALVGGCADTHLPTHRKSVRIDLLPLQRGDLSETATNPKGAR